MKTKILKLISLITAFVLCLALTACGGNIGPNDPTPNPKPNPDPKPIPVEFTMEKAATSLNALANADAISGILTLDTGAAPISIPFDKRGDKARIQFPTLSGMEMLSGATMLFDFDSGNLYMPAMADEYFYVMQMLPQGYVAYAEKAIGFDGLEYEITADTLESLFTYDKTANSLTMTVDAAAAVNAAVQPMQSVYADGGSIEDLIDAYLALLSTEEPLTLEAVLNGAEDMVASLEENAVTFDDAVTVIDGMLAQSGAEASIRDLIVSSGAEAEFEAIKDRKITEALRGALDLLEELAAESDPSQGDIDASALAEKLYEYMFEKPVDTSTIVEDVAAYKNVILSLARSTGFDEIIDELPADNVIAQTLKTIVADAVEFETLKAEVNIGFDKNCKVKSLEFDTNISYTSNGEAVLPVLPDREASISVSLRSVEYSATAVPFELSYMSGLTAELLPAYATSVVCGADGKANAVFYDACGTDISVDSISKPYCLIETDGDAAPEKTELAESGAAFDKATSSFVFDAAVITEARTALGSDIVTVYADAKIKLGLESKNITVAVTYCPDYSAESLVEIPLPILALVENIGGAVAL